MSSPDERPDPVPGPEERDMERRLDELAAFVDSTGAPADADADGERDTSGDEAFVRKAMEKIWAGEEGPAASGEGESAPAPAPRTGGSTPPAPARGGEVRSMRPWLLAAAAVLVAVLVPFLMDDEGGGEEPVLLGGDGVEILAPVGRVDRYEEVRWSHPEAADVEFEVTVWDGRPGREGDRLAGPERLFGETSWKPPGMDTWPDRIRIEIIPFGLDGSPLPDGASAEVERR